MQHSRLLRISLLLAFATLAAAGLLLSWQPGRHAPQTPSAAAATPVPSGQSVVQVALTAAPLTGTGLPSGARVYLNPIEARIYPCSTVPCDPGADASVSDSDPNWQVIPVPPGIGNNLSGQEGFAPVSTQNFFALLFFGVGPAPSIGGTSPGVEQIDLADPALQGQARLFSAFPVPATTYSQAELILDPTDPGHIVLDPSCGNQCSGCPLYQAVLQPKGPLRATYPSPGFAVASTPFQVLLLQVNLNPVSCTTSPNTCTIAPSITPIGDTSPYMGSISGTITGPPPASGNAILVSAEPSGTGKTATTQTAQCPTGKTTNPQTCSYSLFLPAVSAGTAYDLVVQGLGLTSGLAGNLVAFPGQQLTNSNTSFTPTTSSHAALSGSISDKESGTPLPGATVEVLQPGQNYPGVSCATLPTPTGCVVVAASGTDDQGRYPMPGRNYAPTPFGRLPVGTYTLKVTAPGYAAKTQAVNCTTSGCSAASVSLGRGSFSGQLTLSSAATSMLYVTVTAELHGSIPAQSVNATTVVIPQGQQTSADFTLDVPYLGATLANGTTVSLYDIVASIHSGGGFSDAQFGPPITLASSVSAPPESTEPTALPSLNALTCP